MSSHFVLVPGGCHAAWCWYKVATLLEQAGYRITTPELAASGIDPKPADDLKSVSEYSQPLIKFMASLPLDEKVILVGHSFGGVVTKEDIQQYMIENNLTNEVKEIKGADHMVMLYKPDDLFEALQEIKEFYS